MSGDHNLLRDLMRKLRQASPPGAHSVTDEREAAHFDAASRWADEIAAEISAAYLPPGMRVEFWGARGNGKVTALLRHLADTLQVSPAMPPGAVALVSDGGPERRKRATRAVMHPLAARALRKVCEEAAGHPELPGAGMPFGGIEIVEDGTMAPGAWVIKSGDEVIRSGVIAFGVTTPGAPELCDECGHGEDAHSYPFRCQGCPGGKCPPPPPSPEPPPRCPSCCRHGVPFAAVFCAWCEDADDGCDDGPFDDEPQWLCPHGIGEKTV